MSSEEFSYLRTMTTQGLRGYALNIVRSRLENGWPKGDVLKYIVEELKRRGVELSLQPDERRIS